MRVNLPDGWKEVSTARWWTGNKWSTITRAIFYDGLQWREIAKFVQPLSVSISPSTVSGFATGNGPRTITTQTATATPTGGLGPFTYAWTLVSSSGGDVPFIQSPSFATTSFIKTNVRPFTGFNAVFRVTVTDSLGSTATATVNALFEHFGDFS